MRRSAAAAVVDRLLVVVRNVGVLLILAFVDTHGTLQRKTFHQVDFHGRIGQQPLVLAVVRAQHDVGLSLIHIYGLANDSQLNVLKSAYTRNRNIKDEKILCDYWIDDASFLKIDAINLGYTLDLKRWTRYIQSAKIYLTIRDVAVFTDYNGINPEVDINGLNPGFEYVNNTASMLSLIHIW